MPGHKSDRTVVRLGRCLANFVSLSAQTPGSLLPLITACPLQFCKKRVPALVRKKLSINSLARKIGEKCFSQAFNIFLKDNFNKTEIAGLSFDYLYTLTLNNQKSAYLHIGYSLSFLCFTVRKG
jgi:hypothetical protein